MSSSTESPAVAVEPRWPLSSILGWLSFVVGMLPVGIMMIGGGIFGMHKPSWWSAFPGPAWLAALVGGAVALVLRRGARAEPGRVTLAGEAVLIDRGATRIELRRGDIVGGAIAPQGAEQAVALQLADGRTVTARTRTMAEADALLRAVGLDAEKRRFESRFTASAIRGLLGVAVIFGLGVAIAPFRPAIHGGVVRTLAGLGWLAIAIPAIAAWILGTRPPEILVGADGVTTRGLLRRRFIPFRDIASVHVSRPPQGAATRSSPGLAVSLALRDGQVMRIPVPAGNEDAATAIGWRIQLGLAASAEAPDAPARLALLAREARDLPAWRKKLAGVAGVDAGYRAVPLSRDDLEAIVEAPAATVEQRLGAALALRALSAEEGAASSAPRLRVAAERCVSPRLRVALTELADGSDEAAVDEAVAEALADERAAKA